MKKRLRKKFRVGEFREYSFYLSFKFKDNLSIEQVEDFLNSMADHMDAHGVYFTGLLSVTDHCSLEVKADDPKTTNEEQRSAVKAWLEACEALEDVSVSDLEDAWYGAAES